MTPVRGRLLSTLQEPWNLSRAWMRLQLGRKEREQILRLVAVSVSTVFAKTKSPDELRRLTRAMLLEIQRNHFANQDLGRGARAHRVTGASHLDALRAAGRGSVIISLHQGPFHYVATEAAHLHDGVSVFAAPHLKEHFSEFWNGVGRTHHIRLHILGATEPTALLRAVRGLRDGGRVVVFADAGTRAGGRVGGEHAVTVDFLGLPLGVSLGPAFMAQKAGVPLVPAVARRERGMRRVVAFQEPIEVGPGREGLVTATREAYRCLQVEVARRPEQWDGWLSHLLLWTDPVPPPSTTQEVWDHDSAAMAAAIRDGSRRPLVVEPAHVAWLGDGEERLVVHGPTRRLLKASPVACRLLDAGMVRTPLVDLPAVTEVDPQHAAREAARLVLAGLATVG